ncbi:MAG: hypothetical protein COZ16_06205 [Flavobacteriaceae bacterium CG_4_10_14_3_um_filter_31_253]|nr:MAG: hypothetical protein COW43_03685 [Flavobacteriaceae bacterium CG17_big_fil_post_rev_8_21_14_2_50_31_13]PIX11599.1 MAG: hypothetical protein COZ74_13635 [Flavobacteriaceae bacterium CG_4_8_14_3_um_filter_31_8]PIY14999.1 MAG: hypothetical protein COZ16_06205 [Flavobacteriaceae bacterium CG_4_10_14_3_um_filter_31_253]PIZ09638.1 MAG: hypothetical protein COY55_11840 [Flavobacteriaceae bacterium CG_4_10_14_0_8_um_filter_31_99]PJC10375.1 MAG: hypothetical protein CO067_04945 [Flavobacteriacea
MKILLIFFIFSSHFSFGQNMEKHLWKNRVLLISTSDENSQELEKQFAILEKHPKELLERKIIIYSFTKKSYKLNFDNNWKKSEELFSSFIPKKDVFTIRLIGLDGGIKLEQNRVLSSEKLFTVIDGMPMRKNEIRKNNQ